MQGPAVGVHPVSLPRLKVQQQATAMLWVQRVGELWLACVCGRIRFQTQHSYTVHVWSQLLPVVFLGKLPCTFLLLNIKQQQLQTQPKFACSLSRRRVCRGCISS